MKGLLLIGCFTILLGLDWFFLSAIFGFPDTAFKSWFPILATKNIILTSGVAMVWENGKA